LDGDGKADLVRVTQSQQNGFVYTTIETQLNRATTQGATSAWVAHSVSRPDLPYFSLSDPGIRARDVNRDGLADLVHEDFYYYPSGSAAAVASSETVLINQGVSTMDSLSWAAPFTRNAPSGGTKLETPTKPPREADLDGDGFFDLVDYVSLTSSPFVFESIGFGDGTGYGVEKGAGEGQYVSVLDAFTPPVQGTGLLDSFFAYALVDIDGDGLADLVRNHRRDEDE
jgi:hypothetical protein